jgi:ABC-type phosphate transport system substrate-binding protein
VLRVPFFLLSLSLLWMTLPDPVWAEERIAVIVSPSVTDSIDRKELARIYQRQQRFWNNGAAIRPVNLSVEHPLRPKFSQLVLGATPEDLVAYWNEQYFHGIAPPYVLTSEAAIVQFVATTPGAIGYVDAAAITGNVRVLLYLSLDAPGKHP